jgi:hypothetical protein
MLSRQRLSTFPRMWSYLGAAALQYPTEEASAPGPACTIPRERVISAAPQRLQFVYIDKVRKWRDS